MLDKNGLILSINFKFIFIHSFRIHRLSPFPLWQIFDIETANFPFLKMIEILLFFLFHVYFYAMVKLVERDQITIKSKIDILQ